MAPQLRLVNLGLLLTIDVASIRIWLPDLPETP